MDSTTIFQTINSVILDFGNQIHHNNIHQIILLRFRPSSANQTVKTNINHVRSFPSVATSSNARENTSPHSVVSPLTLRRCLLGNPTGFPALGLGLLLRPPGRFTPGPTTLNHRLVWDLNDGTRVHPLRGPMGALDPLGHSSCVTSRSSVFAPCRKHGR